MGRPSKYATNEERQLAKSQEAQRRRRTEAGKEARSQQNRRAYARRKKAPAQLRLRLQYIPSFIQQIAKKPMVVNTHSLFDKHFYSNDPISPDDDFEHWESMPPYVVSNALLDFGLQDTVDAVHGRRMRLQLLGERDLVDRYMDNNRVEVWCDVHLRIFKLIGEAKKLKRQLDEIKKVDEDCIDYVMGTHLLFWKARAIMAYTQYWTILRSGSRQDLVDRFEEVWYTPPTPEDD